MVKEIVGLGTKLQFNPFRHRKVLVDTHVEFPNARRPENITTAHIRRKRPEAGTADDGIDVAAVRRSRREVQISEFVRIPRGSLRVVRIESRAEHGSWNQKAIRCIGAVENGEWRAGARAEDGS